MSGAIPPLPNTPSLRGAQLKHSDNFTLTFYPNTRLERSEVEHLRKKDLGGHP
jgi:hypothetical protein